MSKIAEVLVRIKKACQVCGSQIGDVVNEYDRAKTGQISIAQLQRGFSSLGLRLNPQDLQEISIQFKSGNGISVAAFVSAVNDSDATRSPNPHPEVSSELVAFSQEQKNPS